MKNYQLIRLLIIVFLVSVIVQNTYFILKADNLASDIPVGAVTNGQAVICVNNPSYIVNHTCRFVYNESTNYTCLVNATDPDGHLVNLSVEAPDEDHTFFWITPDGNLTVQTYLNDDPADYMDLVGMHNISFVPFDNSPCTNRRGRSFTYEFEVIDYNFPPVFIQQIADKTIALNTHTVIVDLDEHFMDPDPEDTLTFYKSATSSILLSFNGNEVVAYSTSCTNETVVFTAEDPQNQTAQSNLVVIDTACSSGDDNSGEEDDGSSGGGGGGGFSASCISDWICDDEWSECTPEGVQSKKCIDFMACDPDNTVHWVYKDCIYHEECQENWKCEEWGVCEPDNFQRRTCTELANCGTEELKPDLIRPCEYVPTCSDGIQNQGETGVDCGGPCLPCNNLEIPGLLQDERTISTIMIILAFIVLSLLLIYKYFHKEVNLFVAKSLLSLIAHSKKVILLEDDKTEILMRKLIEIEKGLSSRNLHRSMLRTASVGREYLGMIMGFPKSFEKEELVAKLENMKLDSDLKKVFLSLYERLKYLESKKIKIYKSTVLTKIIELKTLLLVTSNYSLDSEKTHIKEVAIGDKDSKLLRLKKELHNLYVAMIFDEVQVCKSKYTDILRLYEILPEKEKGLFYDDITRAFNELRYLISIQD